MKHKKTTNPISTIRNLADVDKFANGVLNPQKQNKLNFPIKRQSKSNNKVYKNLPYEIDGSIQKLENALQKEASYTNLC